MPLDLIFTNSAILLSKTSMDWRYWQNKYQDYMASLSFENMEELLDYLQRDYKLTDAGIVKLANEIYQNDQEIIEIK